jgi:hypothetical protein
VRCLALTGPTDRRLRDEMLEKVFAAFDSNDRLTHGAGSPSSLRPRRPPPACVPAPRQQGLTVALRPPYWMTD